MDQGTCGKRLWHLDIENNSQLTTGFCHNRDYDNIDEIKREVTGRKDVGRRNKIVTRADAGNRLWVDRPVSCGPIVDTLFTSQKCAARCPRSYYDDSIDQKECEVKNEAEAMSCRAKTANFFLFNLKT